MKNLLILLTICFSFSTLLAKDTAKLKKTHEKEASKKADKYKKELGLNEQQHKTVRQAVLLKQSKMREIKARYKDSANKRHMKTELKQVKDEFHTTINNVLTPEQKVKYDAMRKNEKDDEDEEGDDDKDKKSKPKKTEKQAKKKK